MKRNDLSQCEETDNCVCVCVCRWNQLDLAIVLLSIMGITLEEIEVNASLPINPTIIRIMRVLRIARGMNSQHVPLPIYPPAPPQHVLSDTYALQSSTFKMPCKAATSLGLPFL